MMYINDGPCVTFYAIIFLQQWRVVPLTPTFSCVATACEGADRRNLYAAFAGALCLLNRIDQDANSLITAPPAMEFENYRFPYISAVPKYGVANGGKSNSGLLRVTIPPNRTMASYMSQKQLQIGRQSS